MITIGANGKRIAYGIKHYILDTEADLEKMPKENEFVGTTCFVISTSKYYMLNSDYKWIQISPFGTSVEGGSGGGSGGEETPDEPPVQDDVIYDGGNV